MTTSLLNRRGVRLIVIGALFCGTSLFAQENRNGFDYAGG